MSDASVSVPRMIPEDVQAAIFNAREIAERLDAIAVEAIAKAKSATAEAEAAQSRARRAIEAYSRLVIVARRQTGIGENEDFSPDTGEIFTLPPPNPQHGPQ